METKTGEEILEDVLATLAVLLKDHFEDIDPFEIVWDSNTKEFCNNEQEKFGMVMIDYHLVYQLEIDYDPYTEFELFPTLNHAFTYVAKKVLTKEGFNPKTLEKIN